MWRFGFWTGWLPAPCTRLPSGTTCIRACNVNIPHPVKHCNRVLPTASDCAWHDLLRAQLTSPAQFSAPQSELLDDDAPSTPSPGYSIATSRGCAVGEVHAPGRSSDVVASQLPVPQHQPASSLSVSGKLSSRMPHKNSQVMPLEPNHGLKPTGDEVKSLSIRWSVEEVEDKGPPVKTDDGKSYMHSISTIPTPFTRASTSMLEDMEGGEQRASHAWCRLGA